MGVGDDTVGGVQDAPFSPVRRGPIFTKETIGGDDAYSMDTDEDDRVDPDPDADRFTPQGTTKHRTIADRACCASLYHQRARCR
ncbi:unnamed protein product [Pylaiella littoralis]